MTKIALTFKKKYCMSQKICLFRKQKSPHVIWKNNFRFLVTVKCRCVGRFFSDGGKLSFRGKVSIYERIPIFAHNYSLRVDVLPKFRPARTTIFRRINGTSREIQNRWDIFHYPTEKNLFTPPPPLYIRII